MHPKGILKWAAAGLWQIGGSLAIIGLAALTAGGLGSCSRASGLVTTQDAALPVFPRVEARNLLDEDIVLPDALAGAPAIVHVAFYQGQQTEINTWLAQNETIEAAIEGVQIIETPTMKRGWSVIAGQIDNWMRSGIESEEARARTISMFVDTAKFRETLGLGTDEVNYVLLLDERGHLLHVEKGIFDDAKLDRLIEAAATAQVVAVSSAG